MSYCLPPPPEGCQGARQPVREWRRHNFGERLLQTAPWDKQPKWISGSRKWPPSGHAQPYQIARGQPWDDRTEEKMSAPSGTAVSGSCSICTWIMLYIGATSMCDNVLKGYHKEISAHWSGGNNSVALKDIYRVIFLTWDRGVIIHRVVSCGSLSIATAWHSLIKLDPFLVLVLCIEDIVLHTYSMYMYPSHIYVTA